MNVSTLYFFFVPIQPFNIIYCNYIGGKQKMLPQVTAI